MRGMDLLFFQNKAAGTRYAVTSPVMTIRHKVVFVNVFLRSMQNMPKKSSEKL